MLLLLLRSIAVADWARHQCLAVAGAPESGTPSHSQDGCCCLELLRGAAEGGAAVLSIACDPSTTDTSDRTCRGWLAYRALAFEWAALGGVTLLCPVPRATLRPLGLLLSIQSRALNSDSSTLFQIPAGHSAFGEFGDNFVSSQFVMCRVNDCFIPGFKD